MLVFCLTFSLLFVAGCKKENNSNSSGSNEEYTEEDFFLDMPNELRGTKVQYATWGNPTGELTQEFEKLTGIDFQAINVPQGSYIVKLLSLITADEAPDIFMENGDFPRTLKVVQPILKETTGIDASDPFWDQDIVKEYTIGGKPYLIESANSKTNKIGPVVHFNKTVLTQNGIKTPTQLIEEDNWNLDSFTEIMKQAQQRCGFESPGTAINVHVILSMMGTAEIGYNRETETFFNGLKSPEALTALQWALRRKEEGLAELFMEGGGGSFAYGKGAFSVCGSYGARASGWWSDMDFEDYGVACLPKVNKEDADYPYVSTNGGYGICKGAKNPIGAGYFLRFYLNNDNRDLEEFFKTPEARAVCEEIQRKSNRDNVDYNYGVRLILFPDNSNVLGGFMGEICSKATYNQLSQAISSANNKIDASVIKANELIAEVKAANQ